MNTRIYVNRKLPTMMDSDEIKVSLRKYRDNSGTKAISSGLNTLKSLSLSKLSLAKIREAETSKMC